MKYRNLLLTSLCLSLLAATIQLCLPAISQTAGLIPTGNCSLPAGQYMLTNMRTGQAVYVEIDTTGRLMAQDPRALNFSVSSTGTTYGSTNSTNQYGQSSGIGGAIGGLGGLLPTNGTTNDGTKGSMWGGLVRQGVQQIMNKQVAPGATGAPLGQ
jgi:hypothetical protein